MLVRYGLLVIFVGLVKSESLFLSFLEFDILDRRSLRLSPHFDLFVYFRWLGFQQPLQHIVPEVDGDLRDPQGPLFFRMSFR